jgi:hypothetical protein
MKIERTHKLIAFALLIICIGWWAFGFVSTAQTDHTEQVTIVEAVEKLTAIHIRQDTVEEAEEALLKQLCEEGKLTECVKEDID